MPAHTPHIQAHALNLINLIKLHVNTVNRKKADKDTERKKKEQESTEAISKLKSLKKFKKWTGHISSHQVQVCKEKHFEINVLLPVLVVQLTDEWLSCP